MSTRTKSRHVLKHTPLAAAALLLLAWVVYAQAPEPNACMPGAPRTHATQQCIGIEWDVSGDANHNAVCTVRYRVKNGGAWKEALPLFRIDFFGWYAATKADRRYNMFAGSVLFLQPGTTYEVELALTDVDGGAEKKLLTIATRPLPRLPEGGRTLHVVPGSGGGDGSKEKPFQGLTSAQQAAQPGDIMVLHRGDYGEFRFDKSGKAGQPIVWRDDGDGDVILRGVEIAASHLWLDTLIFTPDKKTTALKAQGAATDNVIRGCSFSGFRSSIVLSKESRDWYIADNTIVGINEANQSKLDGQGIDLFHSEGHVVAHNRVARVQAGVHYARRNCDIHGNDIFDTSDDGIETDYGYANIRIWSNRITNYSNNGISFQPMYCGPWYILYNQIVGAGYIFKFRVLDRFVLAHNTFVHWRLPSNRMHFLLYSLSRNNLYISASGKDPALVAFKSKEVEEQVRPTGFQPNWMTDVDYDGFDWGNSKVAFRWGSPKQILYPDVESFAKAVGIERHGMRVKKEDIFENYSLPATPEKLKPVMLTLRPGCNAVDTGAVLPNINDGFAGKAPDLGAHELGLEPIRHGPRLGIQKK